MRRARSSATCITSTRYLQGYAYSRAGVIYFRCRNQRVSLNRPWPEDDEGRRAVQTALDEWLTGLLEGRETIIRTVDALFLAWLEGPGSHVSHHVLRQMTEGYHMLPTGAPLKPDSLVPHITAIKSSGLAPATVQKRLKSLKRLFAWGVEMGMIARNPVALVGIPSPPKRRDRALFSAEDVDTLCRYFIGRDESGGSGKRGYTYSRFAPLWRWFYYSAMRVGEVVKLRWDDVAADGVRVRGKGGRDRWLPLAPFPELRGILDELRANTRGEYVFPWRQTNSIGVALREAMAELHERSPEAGWDRRRTVHTFRASAEARWREELGLGIELISDLAGHSPDVQLRHYRGDRPASALAAAVERELGGR